MANFIESRLKGNIEQDLDVFEKHVQGEVAMSGAAAMAKVFHDEAKLNTSEPRMGQVTGNLNDAIYRAFSPEKSTETTKVYFISWNKRKAPHGHLLEFGTSRMPAKPFIRPAFDQAQEAIDAGRERMGEKLAQLPAPGASNAG